MSLILIGFSRSGKSYFGSHLSDQLQAPFIDTDRLLERKMGKEISALYAEVGETRFRALEKEILHSISLESPAVIATGGGLPCYGENGDYLRTLGKVVFLDLPKRDLWKALCRGRWPTFLDPRHPVTSFETYYDTRYPLYTRCSTHRIEIGSVQENRVLAILQDIFESSHPLTTRSAIG